MSPAADREECPRERVKDLIGGRRSALDLGNENPGDSSDQCAGRVEQMLLVRFRARAIGAREELLEELATDEDLVRIGIRYPWRVGPRARAARWCSALCPRRNRD